MDPHSQQQEEEGTKELYVGEIYNNEIYVMILRKKRYWLFWD